MIIVNKLISLMHILVVIGPLILFAFLFRAKWKNTKQLISNEWKIIEDNEKSVEITEYLSHERWKEQFYSIFFILVKEMEKCDSKEAQTTVEVFNKLNISSREMLAENIYNLVFKIMENGMIQSILLDLDDIIVYILAFPSIHDQPSLLLKRYRPFARGWVSHAEEICNKLLAEKPKCAIAHFILFFSPDFKERALHLGFQNATFQLLPASLLNKSELKNARGAVCDSKESI